jgi:hypothetical protein
MVIHNLWVVLMPSSYARYYYRKVTNKKLNLKNPRDYNEKVQWLKIHSDTSLWTELADKYKVREYVTGCGLGHLLVKFYGVWEKADEIDFDRLPNNFVLKANNGCGNNILVYDKTSIDVRKVREMINHWFKRDHSLVSFQPHMWNIDQRIIAEELLKDENSGKHSKSLVDYKFYCFHGTPEFIDVIFDRKNLVLGIEDGETDYYRRENVYDLKWLKMNDVLANPTQYDMVVDLPRPQRLNEMIEICKILSEPFPQVRVDLYEVNGEVYFGELTFTPGGLNDFTSDFLIKLGGKIDLSAVRLRQKLFII